MKEVCVLMLLGINAWTDLRKRQVSLVSVSVLGAAGVLFLVTGERISWETFIPMGIGILFLTMSMATGGGIGMGDGWLLVALGTLLDLEKFLTVLLLGLFACAVWAGILLVVLHRGRKDQIPFAPFLFLGYLGGMLLW
ncbi:MAG: prepilin peptidase [Eubacteriales bacterium]|nr:prepilin peptidase [Eubacteriales bacterium]